MFKLICTFLALVVLPSVAAAQDTAAQDTCDGKDPETCCSSWSMDITLDGNRYGALLDPTYAKLQKDYEAAKKVDKSVCAYFKGHADCDQVYEVPRCSDTSQVPELKEFDDFFKGSASDEEKDGLIPKEIDEACKSAALQADRIEKMITRLSILMINKPGLRVIVSVLKDKLKALGDVARCASDLNAKFNLLHGDVCEYGTGCASDKADVAGFLYEIAAWKAKASLLAHIRDVEDSGRKFTYVTLTVSCPRQKAKNFYTPVFPSCGKKWKRSDVLEQAAQNVSPCPKTVDDSTCDATGCAIEAPERIKYYPDFKSYDTEKEASDMLVKDKIGRSQIPLPAEYLNSCIVLNSASGGSVTVTPSPL